MSARKPKFPGRENQFPGFNAQQQRNMEHGQHEGFSSTTPRFEAEGEDSVDYSAVLKSLKNLPADLVASAPARHARSQSGSGGSDGYRSDGVVDFELEVQQFEARSFNKKHCNADLPPFPSAVHKAAAQCQDEHGAGFDMSTAHMRPSRQTTASTNKSSSHTGSLPDVGTPSLRSNIDLPTANSCGSAQAGRAGELPASCCHASALMNRFQSNLCQLICIHASVLCGPCCPVLPTARQHRSLDVGTYTSTCKHCTFAAIHVDEWIKRRSGVLRVRAASVDAQTTHAQTTLSRSDHRSLHCREATGGRGCHEANSRIPYFSA